MWITLLYAATVAQVGTQLAQLIGAVNDIRSIFVPTIDNATLADEVRGIVRGVWGRCIQGSVSGCVVSNTTDHFNRPISVGIIVGHDFREKSVRFPAARPSIYA